MIKRKSTRSVLVGDVLIGGGAPIPVQSMTSTRTEDLKTTVEQIKRLEDAGCQIVRLAVPSEEAAGNLVRIKREVRIPIVADIHFNYRLALKAIRAGVDKVRINPGNIGSRERVALVLQEARAAGIPIRIGINAGSLSKTILERFGFPSPEAMVQSAAEHIEICEEHGFSDIVVSLKSSDVPMMIEANRLFSERFDYPLHLGVTEAGSRKSGLVKSAVGIGTLLAEGIGDTLRVSLTADPVEEVKAGFEILKSLQIVSRGITVISCPTCGRLEVDLIPIVEEFEQRVEGISKPLKVAIMGCAVNGPGEAREADLGIACGKNSALLFKKGKIIAKIEEKNILNRLLEELEKMV